MPSDSHYLEFNSRIGPISLVTQGQFLVGVHFGSWLDNKSLYSQDVAVGKSVLLKTARQQILEYLEGKRKNFDLPLKAVGTDFQMKAWDVLKTIPFGGVMTYGEQAKKMKNPKAVRAVGGANGKNPLAIVVPCHRVIGTNGSLTGFGGGISVKRQLLRLEGHQNLR